MRNNVPLDEKFLRRKPGALQNRALLLQKQLTKNNGSMVVAEVARLCRHVAGLVLKTQEVGLPVIRSYDAAVPILGPTSKIARKISAAHGLDPTTTQNGTN